MNKWDNGTFYISYFKHLINKRQDEKKENACISNKTNV
jgi:hypothetical protein